MGLVSSEPGSAVYGRTWDIILNYEQEARRKMVRLIQKGQTLPQALEATWKCPTVHHQQFIVKLAMVTVKVARPQGTSRESSSKRQRTGDSGGKGKGKGNKSKGDKGKGKGTSSGGCAKFTKDGKPICFRFNNGK